MSEYLKGNYQLPKEKNQKEASSPAPTESTAQPESSTEQFERRALERLGGSIAFVIKRNEFVWKGQQGSGPDAPPSPDA